jgi:hypothetical protein
METTVNIGQKKQEPALEITGEPKTMDGVNYCEKRCGYVFTKIVIPSISIVLSFIFSFYIVSINYRTLEETQTARNKAYEPDIVMLEQVVEYKWETEKKIQYGIAPLSLYNVGLGVAKDIRITISYESLHKWMEALSKAFPHKEFTFNKDVFMVDGYVYDTPRPYNDENFDIDAIEKSSFLVPNAEREYLIAFPRRYTVAINYLITQNRRDIFENDPIPVTVQFEDIQGISYNRTGRLVIRILDAQRSDRDDPQATEYTISLEYDKQ